MIRRPSNHLRLRRFQQSFQSIIQEVRHCGSSYQYKEGWSSGLLSERARRQSTAAVVVQAGRFSQPAACDLKASRVNLFRVNRPFSFALCRCFQIPIAASYVFAPPFSPFYPSVAPDRLSSELDCFQALRMKAKRLYVGRHQPHRPDL